MYLDINALYGPFIAYCIKNINTITKSDDFDNVSVPTKPTTIQDNVTGNVRYVSVLFLNVLCIFSLFLAVIAALNCKIANIIPKYASGTYISDNILLLKLTIPTIKLKNSAFNNISNFILSDFTKNLIAPFSCFEYSAKLTGFTFSSISSVCLNLNEITVQAIQHKKHNIIGIYPFMVNVKPAITDDIASNI